MTTAKVFSFAKTMAMDSIVASTHVAKFLSELLGIPYTNGVSVADEPVDILLIVNGAYAFTGNEILGALGTAIENAKRVVWIQNDYTVIPPKDVSGAESPFRKAFRARSDDKKLPVDYWTTCEAMASPGFYKGWMRGPGSCYINWNSLMFDEVPHGNLSEERLIYYGSFRNDREKYFWRYFESPFVDVTLSSASRKFERFLHSRIRLEGRIIGSVGTYLSQFGAGLYLEDAKSHKEYHSPSTRFYEMLGAGLPMIFQPEAMPMMKKAGYELNGFTTWTAEDLADKMKNRIAMRERQQSLWAATARAERDGLAGKVMEAWSKLQ